MAQKQPHPLWNIPVKHIPLQDPVCFHVEDSIEQVVLKMQNVHKGCVIVLDDQDQLVGILTDRDIMINFINTDLPPETPISEIMTKNVITVRPEDTVSDVIELFGQGHFRHLPVSDGKSLMGLLSVRGLITLLAENLAEDVLNLPPEGEKVAEKPFGG